MTRIEILLACALLWVVSGIGAFFYGRNLGIESAQLEQAEWQKVIAAVEERAQNGAAAEIAKIKVTQQTINRKVETLTREVPVYRDCIHDPAVSGLLDQARSGGRVQAKPDGGGGVP
jgi:hypothetical protein